MIKKYVGLVLFIIATSFNFYAQNLDLKKLENKVVAYNDALQYEKSIKLLSDIINDKATQPYDKYMAYVFKSYTYKRLFNYNQTLNNLELALQEGLKSDRIEQVQNTIMAEKSFVYFDTQDYDKAAVLITNLRKVGYKHLDAATKSWIIMQDGYIKMLNKEYKEAENLLNEAAAIVAKESPSNLPNIYGKKIELYNRMQQFDLRDRMFQDGLALSKKYKKVKYELYLYEVMRNMLQDSHDYKNAFLIQKKYDSISKYYNALDANSKLELTEKKLEDQNRHLMEQNRAYIDYILYGVIISLVLLLFFGVRLYHSNKERRLLLENENSRIHSDIERLTKELNEKGTARLDINAFHLSARQKEIIQLIQDGHTNKEIAHKLCISENTVKYHLKTIYEILNIDHRSAIK